MASVSLANRVKVDTATTGTGTVTLGSATANNYCTFAEAGITDGQTVRYEIQDGTDFEIGTGVYTASGTTMTRASVTLSKISGTAGTTKITLSGSATVSIVGVKEDLYYAGGTDVAVADGGTGASDAATAATNLSLVPTSRTVSAAGIATGGGDLSANRTVTVTAAVQADQETATSTSVAVVPGVQHFHPSASKSWGQASTSALVAGYNVASITDQGTGDMQFNFSTALSSVSASTGLASIGNDATGLIVGITSFTTALIRLRVRAASGGTLTDPSGGGPNSFNMSVFGDL